METLRAESVLPGDNFVSQTFNMVATILIIAIWVRPPESRLPIFRWLITILAPMFVVSGTVQRTLQFRGRGEWMYSKSEVENYFKLSLGSWIACVIVDGTLALNIVEG